jgi:hypothetical protein
MLQNRAEIRRWAVYMSFNGCVSTADSVAAGSSRPITCTAKEDFWGEREPVPWTNGAAQHWLVRFRSWRSVKIQKAGWGNTARSRHLRGRSNVVTKQRARKPLPVVFSRSSDPVHHWSRSMESSPIHGLAGAMIYQRAAGAWPAEFSFWTAQPSCRPKQRVAMQWEFLPRKHPSLPTGCSESVRMCCADR